MKIIEHYFSDTKNSGNIRARDAEGSDKDELISIIVPVYNIAAYVERCVLSVLNQTYKNIELILVDDGSTDAGAEICDRLAKSDNRIVLIHKKNGGLSDARNAGLRAAGGSLIGFVDGDDYIDGDMYEKMYTALCENHADMAVCRYRQIYKDHTTDESVDRVVVFEGQEALRYYIEERDEYNIQNSAWNKLYRREVIEGLTFPVGKWYEDIMYTTKAISRAGSCVYLDTACYNYIIDREGSIMNLHDTSRIFTDLIPAYREKSAFLKSIGRQDLADVHDYFINKRLLIFYNEFQKSKMPDRKETINKIADVINENGHRTQAEIDRIYGCSVATHNEKVKLELFLRSRKLYRIVMFINDSFILPVKIMTVRLIKRFNR